MDELYTLFDSSVDLRHLTAGDHPPLFHFILGLINPQDSIIIARTSLILIALLTLLAFLWALKPLGREGTLLGLVFLASNPLLVNYGIEIRMYGLLLLLTCLVLGELVRLRAGPLDGRSYLRLLAWLVLATQTHAVGIFLATTSLFILLTPPKNSHPGGLLCGTLLLVPTLSTVGWMWVYKMKDKLANTAWIDYPSFQKVFQQTANLFLGRDAPTGEIVTVLFLLLVSIFLIALLGQGGVPYLAGGLFYCGQILIFSLLFKPILLDRTLLPCIPFLAAFLAVRYQSMANRRRLSHALLFLMLAYAFGSGGLWVFRNSQLCRTPIKHALVPIAGTIKPDSHLVVDWALTPLPYFYFPNHPPEKITASNPNNPDALRLPSPATVYLILRNDPEVRMPKLRQELRQDRSETLLFQSSDFEIYRFHH